MNVVEVIEIEEAATDSTSVEEGSTEEENSEE